MKIRRVAGNSMSPTLQNGQIVLTVKKSYRTGDVVIARQNSREVIKRIYFNKSGISLVGDNPNSAKYENVSKSDIVGVVIWPKIKT